MILDAQNLYSDAQALTATADSTNVIDHSSARNLGIGTPLAVLVTLDVATDFTTGNETYSIKLQTSADNSTYVDLTPEYTFVGANVAGTRQIIPLVPNGLARRYTKLVYTLGGTTPTATVTAALLPADFIANPKDYPINYTIAA